MTAHRASILLLTSDCQILGNVSTDGRRLLDVLCHEHGEYVFLDDAQLVRRNVTDQQNASGMRAVIPKARVECAAILGGRHEAMAKRHNFYEDKDEQRVFLVLPGYTIAGDLHLKSRFDGSQVFTKELGAFFPVTNATLDVVAGDHVEAPVVLVNKAFVGCFAMGAELPSCRSVAEGFEALREPDSAGVEDDLIGQLREFRQSLISSDPVTPV